MSKPEIDIVDAVRNAVMWKDRPYGKVAWVGSVVIGNIYLPVGDNKEWASLSHKFQVFGNNQHYSKSQEEAQDHIINDFAEFCEAARLIPAPLQEGES